MKSKRKAIRAKRKRQTRVANLVWVALGAGLLALVGYAVWSSVQPAAGQAVAVMGGSDHVTTGSDPGEYSTNPPTSGPHYADELDAGFYDEAALDTYGPYPEGYLVHNLEHGYVIFWYNCDLLDDQACQNLKSEIQAVMDGENNFKVIAFPRPSIDVPVVMTSWGHIQPFEDFNSSQAQRFIAQYRNVAPEPNAP